MLQQFSNGVKDRIFSRVMGELDPSWLLSHTKVAIASIVGGLLSLVVCGQFGFGFTPIADSFNHHIHENMGPIPCAIICGTLYALFPIAVLRFGLCPPLQFQAIMKRKWQAIAIWFGGFGAVMASMGHHGASILAFAGWILAAVAAANIVAYLMYVVVPSWDSSFRLRLLDQG